MEDILKTKIIVIFVVSLLLSMISLSHAEPNLSDITEGYDENTEITIKGTLTEVFQGMRGPVILKIKTDTKTYNVVTAPRWYLFKNAITFSEGSKLEITGSKYFGRDGKLYIIVRQIKNSDTGGVIILRDSYCRPFWRGHGMNTRRLP